MLTSHGLIRHRVPLWSYVRAQWPWLARLGGLGIALGALASTGPKALHTGTADELTSALGDILQVTVTRPRLEPQGSPLHDFVWGRGLFFEGRSLTDPSSPRDIYRASVATLPNGKLLAVRQVQNMTRTENADEGDLEVSGRHVYYATRAEQDSLTILERLNEAPSMEAHLRELMRSGSLEVYARTHFYPGAPVREVRLQSDPQKGLSVAREPAHAELIAEQEPFTRSPWFHLAADVARGLLGPEPVAFVEEVWLRTFGRVTLRRSMRLESSDKDRAIAAPKDTATRSPSGPSFPPTNPGIDWREERVPFWSAARLAYGAEVIPRKGGAASAVLLTLFDMSRLELGIVGGYREPEPDTGPPGLGHIPRSPEAFSRVVATFNGGFQSVHGKFGMKVDGRLLVRPRPGLATVRVDPDGRVGLGTWSAGDSAETPRAFRQNLEPLLSSGTFDPHGRGHFGDHLMSSGVLTERSALCMTSAGYLIYAWAKAVDPEGLADALAQAGCVYAMHLDMNPGHCSLAYHQVQSFEPLKSQSRLRTPEMRANPERFLKWSPKDFFYLALSDASRPSSSELRPKDSNGVEFQRLRTWQWKLSVEVARADGGLAAEVRPRPSAFIAFGVGHHTQGSRPGLFADGRQWTPSHRGYAALEIKPSGGLALHPTGTAKEPDPSSTWIGLPAIVEQGALTEDARNVGDFRARAAICEVSPGVLLVGRGESDSARALAESMVREGCTLALLLDRGSHHSAQRVDALGTTVEPPALPPSQTWIVLEPRESESNGYLFTASSADASSPLPARP